MQAIVAPSPTSTLVVGILFPVASAFMVAARFQAKRVQRSELLLDDWLTIPALICTSGMGIALVTGVAHKGLGYPTPEPLSLEDSLTFLAPETVATRKVEYALELLQFPALTCTKLSLLLFYRRVFCTPWRTFLKALFAVLIVLCIVWGLGFFLSMAFICGTNFPAFWTTVRDLRTHCPYLHAQETWLVGSDFAIDVIIFIIPIPLVLRLQMSLSRRLSVVMVFLFAAVTVAASATRMVIFLRAIHDLKQKYQHDGYDNLIITAGLYWTMVETGLGLIVVCLPNVYILARIIRTSIFKAESSTVSTEPALMISEKGAVEDVEALHYGIDDTSHNVESFSGKG